MANFPLMLKDCQKEALGLGSIRPIRKMFNCGSLDLYITLKNYKLHSCGCYRNII